MGVAVKGWCPSALRPMESGDGFLVRLKPRAATLSAAAVAGLAAVAQRFGNGVVDLTNRGNLQVRGLRVEGLAAFADWVVAHGLADPNAAAEAVCNVLTDPLGTDDTTAQIDSHALALELNEVLLSSPAAHQLPDKFGLIVDGGGVLPLAGSSADIALVPANGMLQICLADGPSRRLAVEDATDAVGRLVQQLSAWATANDKAGSGPSVGRMKHRVAVVGADAVFDEAGIAGRAVAPVSSPVPELAAILGYHRLDGPALGYFGIGAPFGSFDDVDLSVLASLAEDIGDGTVRTTPWKACLLVGIDAEAARRIAGVATDRGWIVDPADPRGRIVTCAGAPRCTAAHADTRAAARRLSDRMPASVGRVHVSGCQKGCAHPGPAAVTIVAVDGGYDLIRNGAADSDPSVRDIALADLAAAVSEAASAEQVPV